MPVPQEIFFVFCDQDFYSTKVVRRKPRVLLKANRREPEFRKTLVAAHMNVWRLCAIVAGKEEPVGTDPR